jgi:hypothetical protein
MSALPLAMKSNTLQAQTRSITRNNGDPVERSLCLSDSEKGMGHGKPTAVPDRERRRGGSRPTAILPSGSNVNQPYASGAAQSGIVDGHECPEILVSRLATSRCQPNLDYLTDTDDPAVADANEDINDR